MAEIRTRAHRRIDLQLEAAGSDAVSLALAAPRALLNLRGRTADQRFAACIQQALGIALPETPNRWEGNSDTAILWLGPDEWLIMAPEGRAGASEARLRDAAGDHPWFSAVDVSHNYTGFELRGPAAREVLAKGCPLDLHPRRFGPGHCAQSLLAKARVLLRMTEGNGIEIWLRNSYARYAASWLVDATEEFAGVPGGSPDSPD